jgi:HD-GYP domain-containing protein (c-di-GMP phosphodiesterase class II)
MRASPFPIEREIREMHQCLVRQLPSVDRVAAAIYDPGTGSLRTFAHSTRGEVPFEAYEIPLRESPSLHELSESGRPRVIDDLGVRRHSPSPHTRRLLETGYRSSYTLPFFDAGRLAGILFLDSREPAAFRAAEGWLGDFMHLAGLALCHRLAAPRMLEAALRVASRLTHERDPETRSHLDRMAHYAVLIGRELACRDGLPDEFLQYLLLFAPMHDVGKIAIPDAILRKPARLTPAEMEVMRTHAIRGSEIVDGILADLGTGDVPHARMLRNIVRHHHEAADGSGYPDGLRGDAVPLEARIVTVADVYDALTSRRPYKEPWPPRRALQYLRQGCGTRFDGRCVHALAGALGQVAAIAARFPDQPGEEQTREGYTRDL